MVDAELTGEARYRMLETLRSFGLDRLDAAGERADADRRLVQWAVDFAAAVDASLNTHDEVRMNAALRREIPNLRAAWRKARQRGDLDAAVALVASLDEATQLRDFPEVWRWFGELGDDPAVASRPRAAAAYSAASDGAWMLGDPARAARFADRARARADDPDGRWRALTSTAVVELTEARFTAAAEHIEAAMREAARPSHIAWIGALAAAYAGDLERAEALNSLDPGSGLLIRAEQAYVAGEIALLAGRAAEAEAHYHRAIDQARAVGASFVVGVAGVGLATAQVANGRPEAALRAYRDLIDYWDEAGNWLQMWTTLRNLAGLLRRRGDPQTALFLEAAADRAPDAPAVGVAEAPEAGVPEPVAARIVAAAAEAGRAACLAKARAAIDAQLAQI